MNLSCIHIKPQSLHTIWGANLQGSIIRSLLCLAILSVLTLLSACDNAKNSNKPNDAKTNSLKIMFIGQITDTANNTSLPEAALGAKAAVARINNQGGISGTPIDLIICDDKADANEAAKCARKAVREKVICTVGNTSNHGNIILSTLQQAGIPSLGHNPISALDFSSPVAFPLQGGSPTAISGAAKLLADQGLRRIKLAAVDSLAGAISEGFAKTGLAQTNSELVGVTLIPIGAPDYATYAASLTSDSDGILIATNADQAARIIIALRQAGASQTIAAPAVALPQTTLNQLKTNAEGIYLSLSFNRNNSQDYSLYKQDMQSYAAGAKINNFSLQSWLAVTVLERLLKTQDLTTQTISSSDVLNILSTLNNENISDLLPPITTSVEKTAPFNRLFIDKIMYGRVQNNAIRLLDERWR